MIEPITSRPHPIGDGDHKIYRFPNGYGASVIRFNHRGAHSYGGESGLWELGVTRFKGDGVDDWEITGDSPVGEDGIFGWLSDGDVEAKLAEIRDFPPFEVSK